MGTDEEIFAFPALGAFDIKSKNDLFTGKSNPCCDFKVNEKSIKVYRTSIQRHGSMVARARVLRDHRRDDR